MLRRGAVALTLLLFASPVAAEIFRYTDDQGTNHYVEGLESVPQAYRSRATPVGMRNNAAPEPPGRGTDASKGDDKRAATIRYVPGKPIMVQATLNGSTPAQLLLDTGADKTMISPRVLVAAGVTLSRPVGTAMVSGVAGSQQMQFVTLNSLEVAGAAIGKLTVVAHHVDGAGDGLLGRDFLDQFTVNIDSAKGIVTLSPK